MHRTTSGRPGRMLTAMLMFLTLGIGACSSANGTGEEAASSPSPSSAPGPAQVLDFYVAAYNANDIDAVMALFTEESTVIGHPFGPEVNGLELIRNVHLADRAAAADEDAYAISDVEVDGDTVTWSHVWTSSDGEEWCAEGHEAVVVDGAIVEWAFAPDPQPCQ